MAVFRIRIRLMAETQRASSALITPSCLQNRRSQDSIFTASTPWGMRGSERHRDRHRCGVITMHD